MTVEEAAAEFIEISRLTAISAARLAIFMARGRTGGAVYAELLRADTEIQRRQQAAETAFREALDREQERVLGRVA